jgi:phospholipid-binding lipoprotein MlaA
MLEKSSLRLTALSILLAVSALGGCASNSTTAHEEGQDSVESSVDPWESMNRRIFRFNRDVDRATLKPVATAYEKAIP